MAVRVPVSFVVDAIGQEGLRTVTARMIKCDGANECPITPSPIGSGI